MNLPGAGMLEQNLPALPLESLPDLPVLAQVKAAYADPATRFTTLLGVYSIGALAISNTTLLKNPKAKKLVNKLGKASGIAAIALYLADRVTDTDAGLDVDPVAGLGFMGRARTGPTRFVAPAFTSRAVAQHTAARNAGGSRYRVERRRRGDGIPGGASDPVVVIKRIRRVIRQGGYGDAANYSYAGYGMEDYGAYGETAGQKRRRARRAARRARRRSLRRTRIAARRSRRALRRRLPLRRPPRFRRMRFQRRRMPARPIENRVAPTMMLEAQTTPSYMMEDQVDPSASIQQAEDAVADEFDTGGEYDDDGGDVPMGAIALGGAALVGVALLLRNRKGKGKGKRKGKR